MPKKKWNPSRSVKFKSHRSKHFMHFNAYFNAFDAFSCQHFVSAFHVQSVRSMLRNGSKGRSFATDLPLDSHGSDLDGAIAFLMLKI